MCTFFSMSVRVDRWATATNSAIVRKDSGGAVLYRNSPVTPFLLAITIYNAYCLAYALAARYANYTRYTIFTPLLYTPLPHCCTGKRGRKRHAAARLHRTVYAPLLYAHRYYFARTRTRGYATRTSRWRGAAHAPTRGDGGRRDCRSGTTTSNRHSAGVGMLSIRLRLFSL